MNTGFIGLGSMGGMLVRALLGRGALAPENVWAANRSQSKLGIVVIPETVARPAIGLASGGPAMLAYVLQSVAEEAVRNKSELSPELARKLLRETAGATTRLVSEANMTTEEIIRRVSPPGGMTALAIETLSSFVPQARRTVFRATSERANKAST